MTKTRTGKIPKFFGTSLIPKNNLVGDAANGFSRIIDEAEKLLVPSEKS
jgi:hypothetical protein